jgi:biopolymer transport protein ExbD
MQALMEQKANPNFAIVIRADKDADYGEVIAVLDLLRGAGINRFGLATDIGAGK